MYKGKTNIRPKYYTIFVKSFIITTFFIENIDCQEGFDFNKNY